MHLSICVLAAYSQFGWNLKLYHFKIIFLFLGHLTKYLLQRKYRIINLLDACETISSLNQINQFG